MNYDMKFGNIIKLIKENRHYIIVNAVFTTLALTLILSANFDRISFRLTESAHLSIIEHEARVSPQKPDMLRPEFGVFKRFRLNLPVIMQSPEPVVSITAYTIGKGFDYLYFLGGREVGRFNINSYIRKIYKPVPSNEIDMTGEKFSMTVYDPLKPWENRPRLYLDRITLQSKPGEPKIKPGIEYVLPVLGFMILFQGLFSLFRYRYIRYFLAGISNIIFICIGLFSFIFSVLLQTVFLPVLLSTGFLLLIALVIRHYTELISSNKETVLILILFVIGLTFWLVMSFHPEHYHPDLKTHIKWSLESYDSSAFDFIREYSMFQMRVLLGIDAPFPYSPSFYLAVDALSVDKTDILFWVRFLPIFMTMLLVPLIFITLNKLTDSLQASTVGGLVFIFNGIMALRILYFFYPALWGNFFILLPMLFLLLRSGNYKTTLPFKRLLPEIILLTIGFIAYPSGPFTLGLTFLVFFPTVLVFFRERNEVFKNWLKIFAPSILLANMVYYAWYIPSIVTKVIPQMKNFDARGIGGIEQGSVITRMDGLLGHSIIFPVVVAGFVLLLLRLGERTAAYILLAWDFAWLILYIARFLPVLDTLFKFSKDALFLLPLIALSIGYLIHYLWNKTIVWKILAVSICLLLISGFYIKIIMLFQRVFI